MGIYTIFVKGEAKSEQKNLASRIKPSLIFGTGGSSLGSFNILVIQGIGWIAISLDGFRQRDRPSLQPRLGKFPVCFARSRREAARMAALHEDLQLCL